MAQELDLDMPVGGDVIISEYDIAFTRESRTWTNNLGADVVLPPGLPFTISSATVALPTVAAQIANVHGLLTQRMKVADGEVVKVPLLVRGPAVVNEDCLPLVDLAGATYNHTTFMTEIAALGIIARKEPPTQSEHTT